jgi:hypothetical protein
MKVFPWICACLLTLVFGSVVQTYYSGTTNRNMVLHILISRGAGKTEATEVESNEKMPEKEAEAYQKMVSKLYQEGYVIKSAFSPGRGISSNLIFIKGQ